MSEPLFLTREDAAREASVSLDTVRRAINRGDLRAKKVGRRYLIERAALRDWFDQLPDA